MLLTGPPDLELLINKCLFSGENATAEKVLRGAQEAQDAEQSDTEMERQAISACIEECYLQAERGELMDSAQARREIQAMQKEWRSSS